MEDLFGMREHSCSTDPDHVVKSRVDVRLSYHIFLPKDIDIL